MEFSKTFAEYTILVESGKRTPQQMLMRLYFAMLQDIDFSKILMLSWPIVRFTTILLLNMAKKDVFFLPKQGCWSGPGWDRGDVDTEATTSFRDE